MTFHSYPLTPLQEGMLFNSLAGPNTGVEIEQITICCHEPINLQILEQAWNKTIERHEALRIAFKLEGASKPQQTFVDQASMPWNKHNWLNSSDVEKQQQMEALLAQDRYTDFDLLQAPLMRINAIEYAAEHYRLLWSFHHAILDGRSFPIILSEVFSIYQSLLVGDTFLPPLPAVSFRHYLEWKSKQDQSNSEDFWREYLQNYHTPPQLNLKRTIHNSTQKHQVLQLTHALNSQKSTQLRDCATQQNVTLHTLIQVAWALTLHQYNNSPDIVFGSTRACRYNTIDKADDIVGLLINTLPVRIIIDDGESISELIAKMRQSYTAIRQHEHQPLQDIQQLAGLSADQPLFESLLVFENYALNSRLRKQGPDWLKREFAYQGQTSFPLTLLGYDDQEITLQLEYLTARFDTDYITLFFEQFIHLLSELPNALNQTVDALNKLSSQNQLRLNTWNQTQHSYPKGQSLPQLIAEQVSKTPTATALLFEQTTLSYLELEERATLLAKHLRNKNIGPNNVVAILMERSIEMVIALYGTLKAGAAYLPVDPTQPAQRLTYMLEESNAAQILIQQTHQSKLPESFHSKLFIIDEDWPTVNDDELQVEYAETHLAYVIYTSGSTGRPKGVMNEHIGICNRLMWMQDEYQLTTDDAILQKTPYTFDVSVWEFFWPLMTGAKLVIARPEGHLDTGYIAETIISEQISTLHFVPSMLTLFLENPRAKDCHTLKRVICSGEALSSAQEKRFFEVLPHAQLHNLYGPTEAAVDVTSWRCSNDRGLSTVPIGRPIANTQIHILDTNRNVVAPGITGEIYIGGLQVARGYINQPQLTAERFIEDTIETNTHSNMRLYQTGDLGRYAPDGVIEYLGRADFQVKLNGIRIELGELEVILLEQNSIKTAIAIVREDRPGDQRLIAYIVMEEGHTFEEGELRNKLEQHLPAYMLPQHFVILDTMPLTTNGKIDRKALPAPSSQDIACATNLIKPRTPVETTIAAVWTEVLGINTISVTADFRDLGGSSILMLRIYSLLKDKLNQTISVPRLFQFSTIEKLAAYIDSHQDNNLDNEVEAMNRRAEKRRQAQNKRKNLRHR